MTLMRTLIGAAAALALTRRRRLRRARADLRSGRQVRQVLQRGRLQRRATLGRGDRRQLPRDRAAVRSPARTGAAPLRRGRRQPGDHHGLRHGRSADHGGTRLSRHQVRRDRRLLARRAERPSVVFAEHEGSYLVGMLAAMASKTGTVGFVGGMDMPLIRHFGCGYAQGAKAVNPDIKIIANMTGTTPAGLERPGEGIGTDQGADQPGRRRGLCRRRRHRRRRAADRRRRGHPVDRRGQQPELPASRQGADLDAQARGRGGL